MSLPPIGRLASGQPDFLPQDHIERKEGLFSGFFLSAEALAKADVILRGYTNI